MVFRLEYGYQKGMLEDLCKDELAAEFLKRFQDSTFKSYGEDLSIFFRWLKVRKGLVLSPSEFLRVHRQKRLSVDIGENRWALRLALEFSRDNPDFKERSGSHKYHLFSVVRSFCCYFEADLTSGKNVYGKRGARKYRPKQISVEVARRVLGVLPQREKTSCLIMLQSGMSVGDVLSKFSFQREYVEGCLKNGQKRVRVDVDQRKGNGFNYFTFISEDAIQELRKWLWLREGIVRKCTVEGKPVADTIFIKNNGGVFDLYDFEGNFGYHVAKAKLWDGPWSLSSHMLRKLFKTESRPPERGIDQDCVEFMMGHISGIESVGGIYDRTPELAPEVIEKEYVKLEPYINIYTSKAVQVEEKGKKELDEVRGQLSSLTSQVGLLTSMMSMRRIPVPSKEAMEPPAGKALRQLEKEGYVTEK